MNPLIIKLILYGVFTALTFYSGITMDSVLVWLLLSSAMLIVSLIKNQIFKIIILGVYCILAYFYPQLLWGLCLLILDIQNPLGLSIVLGTVIVLNPMPTLLIQALAIILVYAYSILSKSYTQLLHEHTSLNNELQSQGIHENKLRQELIHNQAIELEMSVLDERNRIARDIHDNVGHLLSSSLLQVGALQSLNSNETLDPLFTTLKDTLDDGMNSIRTSVHALYKDSYDLNREISQILTTYTNLDFEYMYQLHSNIPTQVQSTLIYCIKEALTNTTKHSNATSVHLKLTESEHHIYCVIHDNGSISKPSPNPGIGLASIEKRVRNHKGILNFQTQNGYRLYLSIPKE